MRIPVKDNMLNVVRYCFNRHRLDARVKRMNSQLNTHNNCRVVECIGNGIGWDKSFKMNMFFKTIFTQIQIDYIDIHNVSRLWFRHFPLSCGKSLNRNFHVFSISNTIGAIAALLCIMAVNFFFFVSHHPSHFVIVIVLFLIMKARTVTLCVYMYALSIIMRIMH